MAHEDIGPPGWPGSVRYPQPASRGTSAGRGADQAEARSEPWWQGAWAEARSRLLNTPPSASTAQPLFAPRLLALRSRSLAGGTPVAPG